MNEELTDETLKNFESHLKYADATLSGENALKLISEIRRLRAERASPPIPYKPYERLSEEYKEEWFRTWLKTFFPKPKYGGNIQDVDLMVIRFGQMLGIPRREDGKFILLECKFNNYTVIYKQTKPFSLMDRLLRIADPEKKHYEGFYKFGFNRKPEFWLNNQSISESDIKKFFLGELKIEPLDWAVIMNGGAEV